MPTLRDVQIKRAAQIASKQDRRESFRAVLCDSTGNVTGTGDVWANQNKRMVWYLPISGGSPAQVRCVRLEPDLGLGVIIGFAEGSNELEVLSDDPFLRPTGTTGDSYLSVNGRDFEPGGRLQMWLYPEALVPLSVYPGTGLAINVVTGDYEDSTGARQTFPGALEYSIAASQPAGPSEHLLVGIYIDTANSLATVDGSTVSTAATAPEPTWPAGATRLAVVDLNDTQTTLTLADDITNRRLLYPYPGAGGGAWPSDDTAKIDNTEYATVTLAEAAAGAGDTVKIGPGTFSEAVAIDVAAHFLGTGRESTIIDDSTDNETLDLTAAATLQEITAQNGRTGAGNTRGLLIQAGITGTVICRDCEFIADPGSGDSTADVFGAHVSDDAHFHDCKFEGSYGDYCVGMWAAAGNILLEDCEFVTDDTSINVAGLYVDGATVVVKGGRYDGGGNGDDINLNSGTLYMEGPTLVNGVFLQGGGTVYGWYVDGTNGDIVIVGTDIIGNASNFPDIGTTTLAEKIGNIYQGTAKDIYPSNDDHGAWQRLINYGQTPDEHWIDGADTLTWTGWAAYTGYATPNNINIAGSQLRIDHTGASRFFYYRAYSNADTRIYAMVIAALASEGGVMVDDGADTGDGEGADNFIRIFYEWPTATANGNLASEYRTGGGAVTKATYFSLPPTDMYAIQLRYGVGTRWTNWLSRLHVGTKNVYAAGAAFPQIANIISGLTWTPARHGIYGRVTAAGFSVIWDWYNEV